MRFATLGAASILLALPLLAGTPLHAQTRSAAPAATQPAQAAVPAVPESDARSTREQLQGVLQRYPPDVGRILRMDPTMLQNQAYLAQYPTLSTFLASHPEVAHNPGYYLEFVRQGFDFTQPTDPKSRAIDMWRNFLEGVAFFVVVVFSGGLFVWLINTILNHRRWLRISRVQTEVHNKLLDRFAGTGDLLAYVQTPAGRGFLEAAPIPVDGAARGVAPPVARILWSVQAGVVLAIGGLGFQFVSSRVIAEVAEGLWMIGVLAFAFGVGFILSAVVSYVMTRRLGLLEPLAPLASQRGDLPPA